MLSYERKWRFDRPLTDSVSVNFIPEVGATFGNVYTYGQVGALLRIGQNLEADYGPARIRPRTCAADARSTRPAMVACMLCTVTPARRARSL